MRLGSPGQQLREQCGPRGGTGGDLVVAEHEILVDQPHPVVAPPAPYQLRDGRTAPRVAHGAHGN